MRSEFLHRAQHAIQDEDLQRALDQNAERRGLGRDRAFASLPDMHGLRASAHAIRIDVIERLPEMLARFTQKLERNGWHVHHAATALEACEHILRIASDHQAERVVKSKSMVTEEIALNRALEEAGIEALETDLGEYIVQLRNEPPGHIITPAIHLLREEVAETFVEHLGIDFTTDVSALNQAARRTLRQAFLGADIGISGVNFGVADTGMICVVTNEGNGRMVTALPEVHIAVMGIERLVPSLTDLAVMLQLLPRAATGQVLTSYASWIRSPRRRNDLDGPAIRHLILVDNGRNALRHSRLQEALLCIRCGACLNACPVYREIGGHAYESVYPGPIGSVVSPGMLGLERYGHLARASTLCGACREVCPVDIDLPTLLLRTRDVYIQQVKQPMLFRFGMRAFHWISRSPARYLLALKTASLLTKLSPAADGWIKMLPGPLRAWTEYRDFPPFQRRPFRERFRRPVHRRDAKAPEPAAGPVPSTPLSMAAPRTGLMDRFGGSLAGVDGQFRTCREADLGVEIIQLLKDWAMGPMLIDPMVSARYPRMVDVLRAADIEILNPFVYLGADRSKALAGLDGAPVGVTLGLGALADSGTVIVGQDHENAAVSSLLPGMHIALVPSDKFYDSLANWIQACGEEVLAKYQSLTLITGPSRTADIEMTLTIGVHGPERLAVIAVKE
ncbi:MAG: LutB/LldF family L-lactate oxidation iron-sulfur protein [Anaerolineales bacterium]|nr:LutB/LldF family L-lactate oxidation iron-sulfur protein [Anaerolineales bacterium]